MFTLTDDPADVVVRFGEDCALTFGPASPAAMIGARRAYRAALAESLARDPEDAAAASDAAYAALGLHLAKVAIKAWKGVGDKAGKPVPATPKAFLQLLAKHPSLFGQIDAEYVAPILLLDQEKNGSSASATGTSRSTAGRTAKGARIAKTNAAKKKAAKPTPARTAPAARTASTRSAPTKAKSPGKS